MGLIATTNIGKIIVVLYGNIKSRADCDVFYPYFSGIAKPRDSPYNWVLVGDLA
jgi:hypothetical protein